MPVFLRHAFAEPRRSCYSVLHILPSMADSIRGARDFLDDVREELAKVTWPDRAQLKNSTAVILVFVVVVTLLIFGVDFVVRNGLGAITGMFGG